MEGERKVSQYSMSTIYDADFEKLKFNAYFKSGTMGLKFPPINLAIKEANLFIFIEGTVVGKFELILSITDVIEQTAETSINVAVFKCASKN